MGRRLHRTLLSRCNIGICQWCACSVWFFIRGSFGLEFMTTDRTRFWHVAWSFRNISPFFLNFVSFMVYGVVYSRVECCMGFSTMGTKSKILWLWSGMLSFWTRRKASLNVEDSERFIVLVKSSLNVLVKSNLWFLRLIKTECWYSWRIIESSTADVLSLLYFRVI